MKENLTLFSYIIRYDNGTAPNPYHGICTLAICKPVIRRTANVGDWVVGLGSKNSPIGDISGKVVYAMKITQMLTMEEYDKFCRKNYPDKIADWSSGEFTKMIGDCIYDFSDPLKPNIRKSIHTQENMKTDLGGKNVLLSDDFYYFGDKPIKLLPDLKGIVKQGKGQRSKSNDIYIEGFVNWIRKCKKVINENPQMKKKFTKKKNFELKCSKFDLLESQEDEKNEVNCC